MATNLLMGIIKIFIILFLFPSLAYSQSQRLFFGKGNYQAASAVTYTTWNTSDKDASFTLSGGNLTAANNGSGFAIARAIQGISSGKWYWEIKINTLGSSKIGIAKSTEALNSYLGSGAGGYSYADNGEKWNNGANTYLCACPQTAGDVIGVKLDMTAGTIEFLLNNTSLGVAFTGLSGTFYPAVGGGFSVSNYTANFGASAFFYTVPSGYNAGVYQ